MKISSVSYINMDHRIDKNNFMIYQLNSCPSHIPVQRFVGLEILDYLNYEVETYIAAGSQGHKGIIGCWMSHKNVIQHHINSLTEPENDKWILILEDDIYINGIFWQYLQYLDPPENSDMIFFDTIINPIDSKYMIDENYQLSHIYTSWPIFLGTHCYAIKQSSLNKIFAILDGVRVFKDIDGYYFNHPQINKYNYQSKLIRINTNFHSDRLTPIRG